MRFFIAGGNGFLGRAFICYLAEEGQHVTALVRQPDMFQTSAGVDVVSWQEDYTPFLRQADVVVNLVGTSILRRWSAKGKAAILASRLDSTRLLVEALQGAAPKTFLCASAVGFYGARGDNTLEEDSPQGEGFTASVCRQWEVAAAEAREYGHRVVACRFATVLSSAGGALPRMLPVFRNGLGGPLGDGRQWFSWVFLRDALRALLFLAHTPEIDGPVNICAPFPVRNKAFTLALGNRLGRPTFFPVPAFLLRLVYGQAAELVLGSQRCLPIKLLQAGFVFERENIFSALEVIGSQTRKFLL